MARPTTKEQLMQSGEDVYKKLFELIHSIPEEEQEQSSSQEGRDKNIRDVLIHLYEWHQLLLNWVGANQLGKKTNFLPDPYNWRTYPQMNIAFWEKHQQTSLKEAINMLSKSHSETMILIDSFSNEELFTNKYYSWTGTTSLGSYCVSATYSHYDWAMKAIKKMRKK